MLIRGDETRGTNHAFSRSMHRIPPNSSSSSISRGEKMDFRAKEQDDLDPVI